MIRDVTRGKSFEAVCSYCGRPYVGLDTCRGCGAPTGKPTYVVTESTARLICAMPGALEMLCLKNDSRIDVLNKPCGRFDLYDESEVIVRLTNVSVVNISFPMLVDWEADRQVVANVDISCNVEVIP